MTTPTVLDLFCGLGGAAVGYARAGFRVVGVDLAPQPDYPFEFHRDDALAFVSAILRGRVDVPGLVLVHASPPCQAAAAPTLGSNAARNAASGREHPRLIGRTRDMLEALRLPYVIENVPPAVVTDGLRPDVVLCGLTWGLRVFRHRAFELGGWSVAQPPHPSHRGHRVAGWRHGVRYEGDMLAVYGRGGGKATVAECREGLGIYWSEDRAQLVEAIPPAYTEHLGRAFAQHLGAAA